MRCTKTTIPWFILLVTCVSIFTGCRFSEHNPNSKNIPVQRLLFLPRHGSLHVRWEAKHLTIEFKGLISQNRLTTDGHIDITAEDIRHFTLLDRLLVDIYFTDATGRVLDKQTFYSVDQSPLAIVTSHPFKHSFNLPKETSHMAFGYDGTVREDETKTPQKKEHAMTIEFQHSPFR